MNRKKKAKRKEKHDSFSVGHKDGSPGGIEGGRGLKRLDGAKSEMASPTVTQVPWIPRDVADQLTRPQSTPADVESTERWMNGWIYRRMAEASYAT